MRRILVKDAQVGMTLAQDAVNAQQMLLLKKGASLTEKTLRMFKSWGVETIWVQQSATDEGIVENDRNHRADVEETLRRRFGDTIENPIMSEMCRVTAEIVSIRSNAQS